MLCQRRMIGECDIWEWELGKSSQSLENSAEIIE